MKTLNQTPGQRGVAMIMVLWVVSLMTIMAGSYALSTQREAAILSHAHERAKATALADGAIHYAVMMLSLQDPKQRWQADGRPYTWELDGARVRIAILDEGGKIDLNGAQEQSLRTVLNFIVQNDELAVRLTDTILDWRDEDDLKRPHGAEAEEYKAAGLKQSPQNRNFLVMEELRGVLGVTSELYRSLEPWFTLYTGQDGLNPLKASREILLKLARGDQSLVNNFLIQRQQGNAQPFPPVPGLTFQSSSDMAYTILAQAEIGGQPVSGVKATIRRDQGLGGAPFSYMSWKERISPKSTEN